MGLIPGNLSGERVFVREHVRWSRESTPAQRSIPSVLLLGGFILRAGRASLARFSSLQRAAHRAYFPWVHHVQDFFDVFAWRLASALQLLMAS